MSIGMVLLTVVAVLVFFGVAQRVLDKLYLSDRAALILIALMFFGTLIPNVTIRDNGYFAPLEPSSGSHNLNLENVSKFCPDR